MKLNFKFTASIVDDIEKTKGLAIENCVGDTTVNNLAMIISKSLINDDGRVGTSRNVALTKIDEYLIDNDKDTLVLDIMEALVRDGFLSRTLDVNNVREAMMRNQTKVNEKLSNI